MRVTNSMVNRRYLNHLQRNFAEKNKTENKMTSNRKYIRASQSPMEAAQALKVRKALAEVQTYEDNLRDAGEIYNTAENAVRQISDILHTVYEKLIQAANGTYDVKSDKQIIATEIESHAEEMVRTMNLVVADRRIFGGVNNTSLAYKIDNSTVYFNDEPVNRYSDPALFKDGKTSYIDAGMGMTFLNKYDVDPQTVIPVTFNGAQILGCGYDTTADTLYNVNFDKLNPGDDYTLTVSLGNVKQNITFTAAAQSSYGVNFVGLTANQPYTLTVSYGGVKQNITFTASGDADPDVAKQENIAGINAQLAAAFTGGEVTMNANGVFTGANKNNALTVTSASNVITARNDETIANINKELQRVFGDTVKLGDDGIFTSTGKIGELAVYSKTENVIGGTSTYPNNLIQLALDAAKCARSGDDTRTAYYADLIFKAQSHLSLSIAKIGSDQSFVEFNQERLENNVLSLKERQNVLEFTELDVESTNWKMYEMIYSATLQMCTTVTPMTIFNFMK